MPKSILFVQHTPDSVLAKEMRKLINELKPWTKIGIKVVERAEGEIFYIKSIHGREQIVTEWITYHAVVLRRMRNYDMKIVLRGQ